MQILLKKLACLLLTLAVVNLSVQLVYASSLHNCEQQKMTEQGAANNSHCQPQKIEQVCSCDNCGCDMHITAQANIPSASQVFLHNLLLSDIAVDAAHQYSQHFYNPLLRPPIA